MAKASGRKRRNIIISLTQEDRLIWGDMDILLFATSFYKNLFGNSELLKSISMCVPMSVVLSEYEKQVLLNRLACRN
jgi:hypothetical protein